jgi:hypothetical protein
MLAMFWADAEGQPAPSTSAVGPNEKLYDMLLSLSPEDAAGRLTQSQAISLLVDIGQTRWLLRQQSGSSISTVFLVILVFWLSVIFASFGLFAPVNTTVIATFVLCACSVAAAVFLILELDHPFSGTIQIPQETLRNAIDMLGR